jgi:hypothetical protein
MFPVLQITKGEANIDRASIVGRFSQFSCWLDLKPFGRNAVFG